MKKIFINFMISKENLIDEDQVDILKYGLETIYINITKLVVILVFSLLLNILIETTVIIIFLGGLKLFAYGIQMDKSYKCYIFSIFIYCFLPFITKSINIKPFTFYIFLFSITSFILFSPSDTKNRPIMKKRLQKKIISIIILVIYFIIIFLLKNKIADYILLTIIIESFIITPFIYKIFGFKYNNYKEVILWILY